MTDTSLIDRVRRNVAEDSETSSYTDDIIAAILTEASDDVNLASALICEEKAAKAADFYKFYADGASYERSQVYDHWMRLASRYRQFSVNAELAIPGSASNQIKVINWPELDDTDEEAPL